MTQIYIQDYTERSIVVRGDTKDFLEQFKDLGGKWNARLKEENEEGEIVNFSGWIYPKTKKTSIQSFIDSLGKGNNSLVEKQPKKKLLLKKETVSSLESGLSKEQSMKTLSPEDSCSSKEHSSYEMNLQSLTKTVIEQSERISKLEKLVESLLIEKKAVISQRSCSSRNLDSEISQRSCLSRDQDIEISQRSSSSRNLDSSIKASPIKFVDPDIDSDIDYENIPRQRFLRKKL
jgi:hypothetical protein